MDIKILRTVSEPCNIVYTKDWKHEIENIVGTVVLFMDRRVREIYGTPKIEGLVFDVEAKDECKNIEHYTRFVHEMNTHRIDSYATVVSIGGGSVSNLAGFIAGTYKRGIRFVTVPTTLLSMTDACISYKQAINTACGKNQIGCYKVPLYIYIFQPFLETLEKRFISDGYAEVIKHGICENFDIESDDCISKTILVKSEHLKNDPFELHPILMYGHQYGHAIEYLSKDRYYHGESVNIGMIATSHVGYALGIHGVGLIKKHKTVSDTFNLPKMFSCGTDFTLNDVMRCMYNDKSVKGGHVYFSFGEGLVNDVQCVHDESIHHGLNKVCLDRMIFRNGYEMHKIAFGTCDIPAGGVYGAIKTGYRTIDCASFYGNERMIGREISLCIEEGICERKDLFIIGKLWNDQHERVEEACRESIHNMGIGYFDMYLMHWPVTYIEGARVGEADVVDVFTKMKLLEGTLCNNVGVSNFEIEHLEKIVHLKPAMNQIELHPHFQQRDLVDYCDTHFINVMAYSPMSLTAITDETIISIAGKYNTTPHAIILSWVLHTAALTVKSMHHQEENLTSMHIMTEDDFDAIEEKNIRTIQKR